MSKLITREAFIVSLQAIKDFVEKKLKAFSSDVHNIVNTAIESATKGFATKSELDKKVNLDSYALDNNVAIFRHGENSVDLLDSGYSIGDLDLGVVKYAYPVTGDGLYNTSTEIYGYASNHFWLTSDYFIYQDIQLSVPIAKIVSSAPWTMQYFSIPGDINSSYTGYQIPVTTTVRLDPIFIERTINNNIIATEKGVEEYAAQKAENPVEGNIATLDSNSRLVDSGKMPGKSTLTPQLFYGYTYKKVMYYTNRPVLLSPLSGMLLYYDLECTQIAGSYESEGATYVSLSLKTEPSVDGGAVSCTTYTKYVDTVLATESGVVNYVEEKILNTVHTEITDSEYTLPSNTRTIISNPLSTNILFNFDSDTTDKEIIVIFKLDTSIPSDFQCTFNTNLYWLNDNAPTWEAGKTYEISIFNNLALYTSYVV